MSQCLTLQAACCSAVGRLGPAVIRLWVAITDWWWDPSNQQPSIPATTGADRRVDQGWRGNSGRGLSRITVKSPLPSNHQQGSYCWHDKRISQRSDGPGAKWTKTGSRGERLGGEYIRLIILNWGYNTASRHSSAVSVQFVVVSDPLSCYLALSFNLSLAFSRLNVSGCWCVICMDGEISSEKTWIEKKIKVWVSILFVRNYLCFNIQSIIYPDPCCGPGYKSTIKKESYNKNMMGDWTHYWVAGRGRAGRLAAGLYLPCAVPVFLLRLVFTLQAAVTISWHWQSCRPHCSTAGEILVTMLYQLRCCHTTGEFYSQRRQCSKFAELCVNWFSVVWLWRYCLLLPNLLSWADSAVWSDTNCTTLQPFICKYYNNLIKQLFLSTGLTLWLFEDATFCRPANSIDYVECKRNCGRKPHSQTPLALSPASLLWSIVVNRSTWTESVCTKKK